MTAIHTEPHPLAGQIITPVNKNIFSKFGKVRVEDWADRINGMPWRESLSASDGRAADYNRERQSIFTNTGDKSAMTRAAEDEVVLCHIMTGPDMGQSVLLHDMWLE